MCNFERAGRIPKQDKSGCDWCLRLFLTISHKRHHINPTGGTASILDEELSLLPFPEAATAIVAELSVSHLLVL